MKATYHGRRQMGATLVGFLSFNVNHTLDELCGLLKFMA